MVPPSLVFLPIWPQHLSPFLTEDLWCSEKFNSYTVSPLQVNFQTFEDINVRVQAQLRELLLTSSVHRHVRTSSTSGRACVYFTVQYHTGHSGAQCIFTSSLWCLEARGETVLTAARNRNLCRQQQATRCLSDITLPSDAYCWRSFSSAISQLPFLFLFLAVHLVPALAYASYSTVL